MTDSRKIGSMECAPCEKCGEPTTIDIYMSNTVDLQACAAPAIWEKQSPQYCTVTPTCKKCEPPVQNQSQTETNSKTATVANEGE